MKMTSEKHRYGLPTEVINKIIEVFCHFPEIREAILYGSRAKGNNHPGSDIDLTLKGDSLDLKRLNRVGNALDDLLLPYYFDLSVFDQIENAELLEHIERVGVVFYRSR